MNSIIKQFGLFIILISAPFVQNVRYTRYKNHIGQNNINMDFSTHRRFQNGPPHQPPPSPPQPPKRNNDDHLDSKFCRNTNECDMLYYCCAIFVSTNIPLTNIGYCCDKQHLAIENYVTPY